MNAAVAILALACLTLPACAGGSQERLGDGAYGAAQYREALAAYREAIKHDPEARVWAKIGAAALHTNELRAAADAYLRLAGEDPTRSGEAAEGLETVARAAERAGDMRTLQAAVAGLEAVEPERVAGMFTLALARRPGSDPADIVALLPAAIAVAGDPETVDSLLRVYGTALRETTGCEAAMPVYRAVLRRSRNQGLVSSAEQAITECTAPPEPLLPDTLDTAADSTATGVP